MARSKATATNTSSTTTSASNIASSNPNGSTSSDPTPRIISHMNADHADSLTRYLQHYSRLPSYATRSPRLTSLSTNSMTLSSSGLFGTVTSTIPIDPPMKSLAEARERLITMDKTAAQKLGKKPETVKRYVSPQGGLWVWWVFVGVAWVLNSRKEHLRWLGDDVIGHQGISKFLQFMQPYVFGFIVIAHIIEGAIVARKLEKHSVPAGSGLWLKWIGAILYEGGPALARLNKVVDEEKQKNEKAKH